MNKKIIKTQGLASKLPIKPEIITKMLLYFDINDYIKLLSTNIQLREIVLSNQLFKKFLLIRLEFTLSSLPQEQSSQPTRLRTINDRIQQAKAPIVNRYTSLYASNINQSNSNKIPKSKVTKIDHDKISLNYLLKNNYEKIKSISSKHNLSKREEIVIFSSFIHSKLLQLFKNDKRPKKEFVLHNCNLNSGVIFLYHSLFDFHSIAKIDISNNSITSKSFKPFNSIIRYLHSSLLVLNLSNNKLDDNCCKGLFDALRKNTNLTFLDISYNDISSEGIAYAHQFLSMTQTLSSLNAQNNILGSRGISYISQSILTNQSLRTLNLSFNGIQSEGMEHLSKFVSANRKLISLFIGGNYIKDDGVEKLMNALQDGSKISYFFIDDNNISEKGCDSIGKVLSYHPFLNSVDLKNNHLGDKGFVTLLNSFNVQSKLVTLDLTNNYLTYKSMIGIDALLDNASSLSCLILNSNPLGKESCVELGKLIKVNKVIKYLGLGNCKLGGGFEALIASLPSNTRLKIIDLSCNAIGGHMTLQKVTYLKDSKTLNEIILDDNELSDADIKSLCLAISDNSSLSSVSLKNNHFKGDKSLVDIILAIKNNPTIRKFNIEGNNFKLIQTMEVEVTLKQKNNSNQMKK